MPLRQPRQAGMMLATGQLTAYHAAGTDGAGDLGDAGVTRKGLAKAYTILTTGQYSGTTAITINSKTDTHSNNCVLDQNTGLMWSRYATASVGPASDGKLPWTTTGAGATAEGIFAYAAACNAASLGGYSDWRIPNDLELKCLCDMEQPTAAPDATAFPSWPTSDYFWSSTTLPDGTDNAMNVYFYRGKIEHYDKTEPYYTGVVRGG